MLLKEVHHRVKNNLQMISSLLHLQQLESKGESEKILRESQSRIKSIGLVHEILYETKNFSNISADRYLKELSTRVLGTYDDKEISLKFDIDEIPLNIGTAIPCGLIVNELMTNSIKHAFPKNKGKISISFHSVGSNIEMAVSDDGVGIPKDFKWGDTKSLGLKLVRSLADQLDGKIELISGNGTTFKITFPRR